MTNDGDVRPTLLEPPAMLEFDETPEGFLRLLQQGESSLVEFKERLAEGSIPDRLMSAFANAEGGIVIYGVADDGRILGLSSAEVGSTTRRLESVAKTVLPFPVSVRSIAVGAKELVYAIIPQAPRQYGLISTKDGKSYSRIGANTSPILFPGAYQKPSRRQGALVALPFEVPGFIIEKEIGGGASGQVYRGREAWEGGMQVAIKVLVPHPFGSGKDPLPRFRSEVDALRQMNHPGIVRYVSSGRTSREPFLYCVMELVDGEHLRSASRTLPFKQRITVMLEVLDALGALHDRGIFHRDVKPSNVVLRAVDRRPVLVDFGLAYLQNGGDVDDRTQSTIGSPGYVPTEVSADPKKSRSPKNDIFAAGITLYEILSGSKPDPRDIDSLARVDASLATLDAVVQRAIAPERSRYSSAAEFSRDLAEAVGAL